MEFTLVNGRYAAKDSEELLTKLVRVKTDFHLARIDTANDTEEDIKHSEKRIRELEDELVKALKVIRSGGHRHVALHAKVVVEFVPDYHNAEV